MADKTQQQVFQETENSIAKQVVSIAVQEHKANTVMSPLAEGAVAAAQKHPDDALLQAAARVVQAQAAPVKKDKPVAVDADGKKTAGRQALKAKQWLEHQYRIYGRGTWPALRTEASAQADLRHFGLLAGGAAQPLRATARRTVLLPCSCLRALRHRVRGPTSSHARAVFACCGLSGLCRSGD